MRQALYLLSCLCLLAACTGPVTTSQNTITVGGNTLQITSGTLNSGRFISVENVKKVWEGDLKGGKEKWTARQDMLHLTAINEIEQICGEPFYSMPKRPIYNMLDNDETLGGAAPVLGVEVSMVAYLVAEAKTQNANIPTGVYIEFGCQDDKNNKHAEMLMPVFIPALRNSIALRSPLYHNGFSGIAIYSHESLGKIIRSHDLTYCL